MKQFWANHKIKLLVGAAILAVLAAAFYFGGSDPDSRGWSVSKTGSTEEPLTQEITVQKPVAPDPALIETAPSAPEEAAPAPDPDASIGQASVLPDEAQPDEPSEPSVSEPDVSAAEPEIPAEAPETPSSEETASSEEQSAPETHTCTISIRCTTILDHLDEVSEGTKEILPADGWILYPVEVAFSEGETVFDVLQRVLQERKIHLEFSISPLYGSAYIEGISNLYEFDCGSLSGWMYSVNGWFPNYGCSSYVLSDADRIEWQYTCDLGYDVGGGGVQQ